MDGGAATRGTAPTEVPVKSVAKRPPTDLSPQAFDAPIARSTGALTQAIDVWDRLHPLVLRALEALSPEVQVGYDDTARELKYTLRKDGKPATREAWLREVTHDVVVWTEKIAKALSTLTKSVDECVRLREFITGGPESRPDLANASDQELLDALVDAAIERGLVKRIVARAKELEVEVV